MNDDRRGPKEGMKNSFLNAFVFSDLFLYSFFFVIGDIPYWLLMQHLTMPSVLCTKWGEIEIEIIIGPQ